MVTLIVVVLPLLDASLVDNQEGSILLAATPTITSGLMRLTSLLSYLLPHRISKIKTRMDGKIIGINDRIEFAADDNSL